MTKIITPGDAALPRALDLSAAMADREHEEVVRKLKEHKERISRVALAVEKVLVDEGCTWSDWNEVVGKFNDRNNLVIPRIKMSEIRERHDALTSPKEKTV